MAVARKLFDGRVSGQLSQPDANTVSQSSRIRVESFRHIHCEPEREIRLLLSGIDPSCSLGLPPPRPNAGGGKWFRNRCRTKKKGC
jgi:hypothetical protein